MALVAASGNPAAQQAFLHNKVVQLARALAKVTRERNQLDMELASVRSASVTSSSAAAGSAAVAARPADNSHQQLDVWRSEVASLRAAIENHVASDRRDRHQAQLDKEVVLNEVAEELGQVMAQRDLAFVELEKLRRQQERTSGNGGNGASGGDAPSVEVDGLERQVAALQLQLAHARRDVTLQSVNLHVARERHAALRTDIEKACGSIQTTSEHCARVSALLNRGGGGCAGARARGRMLPPPPSRASDRFNDDADAAADAHGAATVTLSASEVSELLLFVARVRSDFNNVSSLLREMRADALEPPPQQVVEL